MRSTSPLLFFLFCCGVLAACGGNTKTPTGPAAGGGGDGGAEAGARAALAPSPPPSGLPPMASMPPPGVTGSKKAKKKTDAALYTCGAATKPSGKDPADLVKRIGEACAAASKMKPSGALVRGQQGEKDAHQEHKLRVDANKCYRVYFATDEGVREAVVVVRDSAGDVVAEAPSPAVPEDGAMCFTSADDVSLLVAVGAGKGAYAMQVWSD
jgi:hypothetical protein